ncbi:hypothetical protein [Paenibacillus puerhi]|uniref:hypothetical protein n=1 Tax=Paenibacillus puerhi TaxID=2692622 RepID=UPI00135A0F9F|nr:hypothetical protein [Paenibacillus puerhi]
MYLSSIVYSVEIIVIFSLLIVISIIKKRQRKKRNDILKGILAIDDSGADILLFVDSNDDKYINYIDQFREQEPSLLIQVVYHGPEWKKNLIERKLPNNTKLFFDEKITLASKLGIYHLPSFIVTREKESSWSSRRMFEFHRDMVSAWNSNRIDSSHQSAQI